MVPKISNFHYLGLKELKCAVVCYFQGFYSIVWQFGTSAFHMVVLWHKLGEVENECTSHNFSLLAIFLRKIKFGGNSTKFWQLQICLVFLRHGVVVPCSRVRVTIRFSVCLVSCYAHVFVLLSGVIVTLPSTLPGSIVSSPICCSLFTRKVKWLQWLCLRFFSRPMHTVRFNTNLLNKHTCKCCVQYVF